MNKIDFVDTDCFDLACHKGTTFNVDCLIYDDCTNIPNDLTGYSAEINIYDPETLAVIINIDGTIAAPTDGIVNFQISSTDTNALTIGYYLYYFNLISPSSSVYRMTEGKFEVVI